MVTVYFVVIRYLFLSAWFVITYCCLALLRFFFDVLLFVCLFCLLGINKFDIVLTCIVTIRNQTNKMLFLYIFYSKTVLYMFRTNKLFILRRHFLLYTKILVCIMHQRWLDGSTVEVELTHSSVGIATRYRLEGPGIESQWGRDFPHPSRPALGPTRPPMQWVRGLYRG